MKKESLKRPNTKEPRKSAAPLCQHVYSPMPTWAQIRLVRRIMLRSLGFDLRPHTPAL